MTEAGGVAAYGRPEYWDLRYQKDPEPLEWHQLSWPGLKESFSAYVKPEHHILNVGCGNSVLSEEMFEDGFRDITNIDVSAVVIKAMQDRYQDKSGMVFKQMDCRRMDFNDGSFETVIDKALLDSIVCGEGSTVNAHKYLSEVSRVLSSSGTLILVSHGQPQYRMNYLNKPEYGWSVTTVTVPRPLLAVQVASTDEKDNVYYIYICQKGNKP